MRIPTATYRLQFHKDFGFAQATDIVEYLHELGISDIYASPIFKARAGSMHGYDVVDHSQIDPALGGEEIFEAFTSALKTRGMGFSHPHRGKPPLLRARETRGESGRLPREDRNGSARRDSRHFG